MHCSGNSGGNEYKTKQEGCLYCQNKGREIVQPVKKHQRDSLGLVSFMRC